MTGLTTSDVNVIDERDISAEVMAEILMDDKVSTYKMFEELESLYASDQYDKRTIDVVLMTITNYDLAEIKEMVDERIKGAKS